jgi:hypothetical protein
LHENSIGKAAQVPAGESTRVFRTVVTGVKNLLPKNEEQPKKST